MDYLSLAADVALMVWVFAVSRNIAQLHKKVATCEEK